MRNPNSWANRLTVIRWLSLGLIWLCLCWPDVALSKATQPQVHKVHAGQTLGRIAKRYNVTISAICSANGLRPNTPIKPGQVLVIPTREDKDGRLALAARNRGEFKKQGVDRGPELPKAAPEQASSRRPQNSSPSASKRSPTTNTEKPSWLRYKKAARRPGFVTLQATGRRWSGYAIVKGNKISTRGHDGFKHALYSWRSGDERTVDGRLIRLLVKVSDTFGGRPLKIVSGFREHSHQKDSRHKHGQACDFAISGVPNEALRDYLLTLEGVGVGYYPNSSFVHLDVRKTKTTWVDHSGPGQAPRFAHKQRGTREDPEESGAFSLKVGARGPDESNGNDVQ